MSGGMDKMGQRLQQMRQTAGLSQSELARAAGISLASLKNWEQGHRALKLDAAWKLSRALGITLDELVSGVFEEPDPTPKPKGRPRKPPEPAQETPQAPDQPQTRAGSEGPPKAKGAGRKGRKRKGGDG